jgi:type IV pilus assembly protein PilY1
MKTLLQVPPATTFRPNMRHIGLMIPLLLSATSASAGTIAQQPLFLSISVPPNVILAVDDSFSMQYEVLMSSGNDHYVVYDSDGNPISQDWLFPDGNNASGGYTYNLPFLPWYADARSHVTNHAYFNPYSTYSAWPSYGSATFADADPTAAKWEPVLANPTTLTSPACLAPTPAGIPKTYDLTQDIKCSGSGYTFLAVEKVIIPEGTEYKPSSSKYKAPKHVNCDATTKWCSSSSKDVEFGPDDRVAIRYFPATFFLPAGTDSPYRSYIPGKILEKVKSRDGSKWDRYEIRSDNFSDPTEYSKAIQNFANWFTYSRKRRTAIQGAIGATFTDTNSLIQNMYLGMFRISETTPSLTMTDMHNVADVNALFAGDPSKNITGVYNYTFEGNTPSLQAVNRLGQQFKKTVPEARGAPDL